MQVRDFHKLLERTPANHRDLAELALLRLHDLKDDLENGDNSLADILVNGATLETEMRRYIGKELRDKAQDYVLRKLNDQLSPEVATAEELNAC